MIRHDVDHNIYIEGAAQIVSKLPYLRMHNYVPVVRAYGKYTNMIIFHFL